MTCVTKTDEPVETSLSRRDGSRHFGYCIPEPLILLCVTITIVANRQESVCPQRGVVLCGGGLPDNRGSVRERSEITICRVPAVQVRLRTSSPPRPQTTCMGSDQQFHRSICEGLDNNLRLREEIGHVSTKHCALNNNSRRKLYRAR